MEVMQTNLNVSLNNVWFRVYLNTTVVVLSLAALDKTSRLIVKLTI